MKYLNTGLAALLIIINWYRYHLPVYVNNISLFDTLTLISLGIACLIALIKPKNLLTEGILIFTILGVIDSIIDELFLDPTYIGSSDNVILVSIILISLGYITYKWIFKKLPLL